MYLEKINSPEDVKKLNIDECMHWQQKCGRLCCFV